MNAQISAIDPSAHDFDPTPHLDLAMRALLLFFALSAVALLMVVERSVKSWQTLWHKLLPSPRLWKQEQEMVGVVGVVVGVMWRNPRV